MTQIIKSLLTASLLLSIMPIYAQTVNYSVVSVGEEAGLDFKQITNDGDYVEMPSVKRFAGKVSWDPRRVLAIFSSTERNYSSPSISPDGEWVLMVGDNSLMAGNRTTYSNTDIFVCRLNGADLTQLTYHAADDLSPVWSPDGRFIYFVSKRGSSTGTANIWRIPFIIK